ncbi:TBC1 domain family member 17-like [Halichondria panicea]|uniref:TBC1 domain family member 17-like n=1 Tax=Halichondria panicea TaxID=6063 RepID=UPI00312BC4A5
MIHVYMNTVNVDSPKKLYCTFLNNHHTQKIHRIVRARSCSWSVGETSNECGICQEREESVKKCVCEFKSSCENLSQDDEALLKILDFPSRVYAARRPVQLETSYPKARRIVLRDVARTDKNYHYFTHKRNLRKVHRILLTYAMFHPEVGYAQGMNDILARFLVVTDSEVDSYWLFASYMSKKREDFLEHTMMRKVAFVKNLVREVDRELYGFFDKSDCRDYLFMHRWLLLDFKREFPFEEALRIFEVLNSQYLELNSDRALVVTDKVIAKEFEMDAGETRSERSEVNLEFTFDVFVCVAILTMNSNDICKASDAAGIYGCLNGLSMKMNLTEVLTQAEELFYKYCRQNITRGFAEIDF